MAKLTKRTTEQLRSHLSSLSSEELVEVLLAQAARDDALRDRLLIEAAKQDATKVDLKSFRGRSTPRSSTWPRAGTDRSTPQMTGRTGFTK